MSKKEETAADKVIIEEFDELINDPEYLEDIKGKNEIIKILQKNADIIKSSSFFYINNPDNRPHTYDIKIAEIFEYIISHPSSSKTIDLLEELLIHDPLKDYEYKLRYSNKDNVYGISESIHENYFNVISAAFSISPITNAYKLILGHGFFPEKFTQLDDETQQKYNMRIQLFRNIRGRVFSYKKAKPVRIIEDEQIKQLEDIYKNMCYNRVEDETDDAIKYITNTDDVSNTHDLEPEVDIITFIINNSAYCYERSRLMKDLHLENFLDVSLRENNNPEDHSHLFHRWIKNEESAEWVTSTENLHKVSYFNMSNFNEGYGGKNGNTTYVKLLVGPLARMIFDVNAIISLLQNNFIPYAYFLENNNSKSKMNTEQQTIYDKMKKSYTKVFEVTISQDEERIGEHSTSFGVSETHGQNDIVPIHTLQPLYSSEDEDIQYFIRYYNNNIDDIISKIKQAKGDNLFITSIFDKVETYYNSLIVDTAVSAEEKEKSYMTIFKDDDFVNTIPINGPKFNTSNYVIVNIPNAIENLRCIIRYIYREPELPENRKVTWIYLVTHENLSNISENIFTILDENTMTLQPDEIIPVINREMTPQQRGDDISLNSDGDHTQFTDWIRGNEESDNDEDEEEEEEEEELFIPFGLDYEPSSPVNLDDDEPPSPIYAPSSPRYPPPNNIMTIDELDISGIEDDRADRADGVPPNFSGDYTEDDDRLERLQQDIFGEDTEDEPEPDSEENVGFGGGDCAAGGGKKKQKQTKNNNKKIKKKRKTTRRNKNKIKN